MKNFRDLGGIASQDGRVVKKGYFYRSANLENLSKEDVDTLKKLNIKCIFDYRSDNEANNHPSTEIEGIKNIQVPAMNLQKFSGVKFGSIEDMIDNMFEKSGAFNMLKENYHELPINNPSYRRLLELVRDPDMLPLLNHCTAGKDRTGVGSAIILMILGVSRENIIKDYLKSNDFAENEINNLIEQKPEFKKVDREKLNHIFGVNLDYINAAFDRIDDEYKTVEDYLNGEFGLDLDELNNLRNMYLE
ncbi:tyrosine-protein phosphatase [Metaclostridioides mangenotii]|uniref:Protein-tyrosine phosphatase n=1 Tax=Metaclostridioides mangenotii TaxID=1540 RepID=A0ABS4E769_9FIRM|nr:tyrosine-protein phosphatase [Clostridioides mangenotii]MBP1853797.1 protein-tyrosine phosphatase [Clostridioides mangenotii]